MYEVQNGSGDVDCFSIIVDEIIEIVLRIEMKLDKQLESLNFLVCKFILLTDIQITKFKNIHNAPQELWLIARVLFALYRKGEWTMEFIVYFAKLFLYLSINIYIFCALVFVLSTLYEVIERMVNWLGNKISEFRTTKSLRK